MNAGALPLRIGTRGSPLALKQAALVRERLVAAHPALAAPDAIRIETIRTTGDKVQDRPLAEIGGKGLFSKEIEEALLDGRIDLAVHSMKDMETVLRPGLAIAAMLEREDPRDALLAREGRSVATLPQGAVVGSASLRRRAQLLAARPDLSVVMLRGNVGTRLEKLASGAVDATILAIAGLKRLGMADRATAILAPEEMLPAAGQGAIGVEIRADDPRCRDWLAAIDHAPTRIAVAAERACLAALDGSCRTPIAVFAEPVESGRLRLRSLLALPDGSKVHRDDRTGDAKDSAALGRAAGEALRGKAEPAFFDAMKH